MARLELVAGDAVVVVDGSTVCHFKVEAAGYTPEGRAKAAHEIAAMLVGMSEKAESFERLYRVQLNITRRLQERVVELEATEGLA